jgi:hypothetical protein
VEESALLDGQGEAALKQLEFTIDLGVRDGFRDLGKRPAAAVVADDSARISPSPFAANR